MRTYAASVSRPEGTRPEGGLLNQRSAQVLYITAVRDLAETITNASALVCW